MSSETIQIRQFGKFRLDVTRRVLWANGEPVNLPLKEIELLCVLTEKCGEVVTRDELLNRVWADSFVDENNLSRHIYLLRRTFKEFSESEDLIQTVPRRGYRFAGQVTDESNGGFVIEKHTLTRTVIEEIPTDADIAHDESSIPRSLPSRQRSLLSRPAILVAASLAVAAVVAAVVFYQGKPTGSVGRSDPQSATLDKGFSVDNRVITHFGFKVEKAMSVATQPGGKLIVGGWAGDRQVTSDFALARYNPDGTLDRSFHGDGKVITPIGERSDIINAVGVQPDGKILAAGVTFTGPNTRRFVVARYRQDGALDASFDEDGIVTMGIGAGQMDTANALVIQPDGKIVVAGSIWLPVVGNNTRVSQNDFGLIRLNSDGALDTSFGDGGKVITDFGFGSDIAYAVALQPDSKIVAAGVSTNGTNQDFAVARYNSNGTLDTSFGKNGKVRTDFYDEEDLISALTIQPDGKIVAAGYAAKASVWDLAVARYSEDGSLDNSFNGTGKLTVDINGNAVGRAVQFQADGKLVVGVYANHNSSPEFAFVRLLGDGRLDEKFFDSGKTRVSSKNRDESFGMVLTADGYALSVGSSGDNNSSQFTLVRVPL